MNTSKPIATVSYNSVEFLTSVLDELVKKKIIVYYQFIKHIGEINEVTGEQEKDHIHVYVEPNIRVNTMVLAEKFIEPVPGKKPLKTIAWVNSVCDDWILYCLHDETYLMTKFEHRQEHYTGSAIHTSDEDDFIRRYTHAYQSSGYARNRNLYSYIKNGGTFCKLLEIGAISPNQVTYYDDYFKAVKMSGGV